MSKVELKGGLMAAGKINLMANGFIFANAGMHTAMAITFMPTVAALFVISTQIIGLIILRQEASNETVHI